MTDDDKRLNDDEMGILVEALEAWVDKDAAGELMSELLIGLVGDKGDAEAIASKRTKQKEEAKQAKQLRKEKSILLQGKLIRMRDALVAEGALA